MWLPFAEMGSGHTGARIILDGVAGILGNGMWFGLVFQAVDNYGECVHVCAVSGAGMLCAGF